MSAEPNHPVASAALILRERRRDSPKHSDKQSKHETSCSSVYLFVMVVSVCTVALST
jgi:hypothetical protein